MDKIMQEPNNTPTNEYFIQITDTHKIYTDQIGQYLIYFSWGMQYCFVMNAYDANAILRNPIRNRNAPELLKSNKNTIIYLTQRETKASKTITNFNIEHKIKYQLVHPISHQGDVAKRSICTWKYIFITGLCTVSPALPLHLWDRFITQSS